MECLFCKIVNKELPASILYEDKDVVAFRDIHAQAPTHILVIPKKHLATLDDINELDQMLMGRLMLTAKTIANNEGLGLGYRLVVNIKAAGGQEVPHLHLHILGGRQMTWPPG